jgi:hypothetical protein
MFDFDSTPSFDGRDGSLVLAMVGSKVDVCGVVSLWVSFMPVSLRLMEKPFLNGWALNYVNHYSGTSFKKKILP